MTKESIIFLFLSLFIGNTGQLFSRVKHVSAYNITFETDYTDSTLATKAMHNHLNIYNRISPINGFRVPATANSKLCIVRPLGGKYSNGNANISEDTYLWDEENQRFYTDFTLLKNQIDGVFNRGVGIYQIVLDNPSWAFQRDSLGNLKDEELIISTYGNAEPPRDFDAWAAYLKEVMSFLISTYGQEEMLKIQFAIGREIGTAGHWTGTKEQFFDFYKKSVRAIHEVLPEAKIGSHFLWGTSNNSWGPDFVKWCKNNNVHYDFMGVSYYPFYHRADRTNFTQVYTNDFGVIKDIPEWNENAQLEIHEYALIERMIPPGNAYDSAPAEYQNSFLVGLMKMFYENNIYNLFQWGTGTQYMPASTEIMKMEGNIYYKSTKSGTQQSSGNYVDAIFAKDTVNHQYNIMVYNYNANPSSNTNENITVNATINAPPGTDISFRLATYNKSNNSLPWSEWHNSTTHGTSEDKSTVSFNTQLPVFSFLKYEIVIGNLQEPDIDINSMIERLVFYYPLESDGTDLSGNENHAVPGNAVTFVPGKFGNAAAFSYTEGSYLTSADSIYWYNHPTAYTIAFWLKVTDYSARGDILQPTQGRTLLYSNGDQSFSTFHQRQAATFSVDNNEKDEWFHVAMVIDQRAGQTLHNFFVNGEQRGNVQSGYALETDRPQSISRLVFGAASDVALSRNFTGMIDDIYMFDEVLSDDEIAFLMNTENLMALAGQTSIYINFDDPATASDWILEGTNVATASVVDFALSRNGSKALKVEGFNTNTGFHFHNISAGKVAAKPGQWVHSIIHASSAMAGGQAAPSFRSEWVSVTPGFQNISSAEMTRLTFRRQYPDTETDDMDIFPRLRLRPGADLSNEIYFDDLVLYVHDSDVTDLVAPEPATDFTYVSQTANLNIFSWTEGLDALTGVQMTYILRTSNTSAEAPVLLPQVGYSVAGGAAGPNTIGDWTVIATVDAGTTSYTDETVAAGEDYLYAIVHKDLAYNNSVALISPFEDTTSSEVSGTTLTETKITVYPVPVQNTLYIDAGDIVSAQVYNTSGMLLINYKDTTNGLDVSSLKNGIYILHIVGLNGEVANLRFIKL